VDLVGLPLQEGRFVGGFLTIAQDGRVVFDATSGTFPSGAVGLPANVIDMVRGLGLSVVE
jgi:hypothetical protein